MAVRLFFIASMAVRGWLMESTGKLNSSPVRAKATVLATADYRRLPPFGQERPATPCVVGLCYYSTSSPVRVKANVLATADYRRLPPFGQERPATLCVVGLCYLL